MIIFERGYDHIRPYDHIRVGDTGPSAVCLASESIFIGIDIHRNRLATRIDFCAVNRLATRIDSRSLVDSYEYRFLVYTIIDSYNL